MVLFAKKEKGLTNIVLVSMERAEISVTSSKSVSTILTCAVMRDADTILDFDVHSVIATTSTKGSTGHRKAALIELNAIITKSAAPFMAHALIVANHGNNVITQTLKTNGLATV
nr:uncharacterized protein LOC122272546 [Parasteatoda tepidariorum]